MKNARCIIFNFAIILVVSFFCGCSTFKPNTVYRDWTSRMSELGIYPVFPPREDVSVGDIYLLPMHPYQTKLVGYVGGLGMAGIRIGFLNGTADFETNHPVSLAELLTREFTNHPAWMQTPPTGTNSTNSTDVLAFISVPGLTNNSQDIRSNIFDSMPPYRLKQVAFPEFSVTVADEGSLSALVPVEAFLVNAGFDFSHVSSVSIKIPQAESYGLPVKDLVAPFLSQYVKQGTNSQGSTNLYLVENSYVNGPSAVLARSMFNESLELALKNNISWWHWYDRRDLLNKVKESSRYLYMGLITEVYYARALDVSVNSSGGFGGAAGVRPVTPDDLLKLEQLGLTTNTSTTTNSSTTNGTNLTFSVTTTQTNTVDLQSATNAIAMANQLKNLNYGQNTVGGSMQLVSASSYSIGLRRTFQYPVAVGVRGVILRFNYAPEMFTPVGATNAISGFKLSTDPGTD